MGRLYRFVALNILCTLVGCLVGCRSAVYVGDEDVGSLPGDSGGDDETTTDTGLSPEDTDSETDSGEAMACEMPSSFAWESTQCLIEPPADVTSIKDPTVLRNDGVWHIYATAQSTGLSTTYLSFTDWAQARDAAKTPITANTNLSGYVAAPQLFYFSPQELWYLVFQTQEPAYSTSTDPSDVLSWSAPELFMPMPAIVTENGGAGMDYWVICDDAHCYLFFSGSDSDLYRAKTAKTDFPSGFEGTTEEVMSDEQNKIHNGGAVYRIAGSDQYLLLMSAIGSMRTYYRSWTSSSLEGPWISLADTESNAFASTGNVVGAGWTRMGIVHGEILRTNPDETMTVDICDMQFLYSGLFSADGTRENEYYCLALLSSM